MENLIAIFCIFLFSFGLRIPFALEKDTDEWLTYLLLRINRSKKTMDLKIPRAAVKGEAIMPYPQLSHFFASRLPQRFEKIGAYFITYASDTIVAVTLFFCLQHVLTQLGYNHGAAYPISLASGLSLVSLPILLPVKARVKAANGRALGFLFATFYFICLWMTMHVSLWFILCATVFTFLTILASKFALQVVFFFTPLMALLMAAPILLIPLAIVVLTVLVKPRSIWASICVDKITHTLRYKIVGSTAEHRNLFKNFLTYFRLFRSDYRSAALMLRFWSPLLIALTSIPYVFILLTIPLFPSANAMVFNDPILSFSYYLALSATIVFIITSMGIFRVFGESERYFEYASPFVIFFLVGYSATIYRIGPELPFFMLGLNIALLVYIHVSTNFPFLDRLTKFDFSRDKELLTVHRYLSRYENAKVGAIPIKMTYILMGMAAQDNVNTISYYHPTIATVPVKVTDYKLKKNAFTQPFIFTNDPEWVKKTFGIDTWVEDIAFAEANMHEPFVQALRKYKPAYETEKYRIYRINPAETNAG